MKWTWWLSKLILAVLFILHPIWSIQLWWRERKTRKARDARYIYHQ